MTDGAGVGCPESLLCIGKKAGLSYAPYNALEASAFCCLTHCFSIQSSAYPAYIISASQNCYFLGQADFWLQLSLASKDPYLQPHGKRLHALRNLAIGLCD